MTTSALSNDHSESSESFLATFIAKAQAAADACVALHLSTEASSCSVPTSAELREMDDACDRWLAKQTIREVRAA